MRRMWGIGGRDMKDIRCQFRLRLLGPLKSWIEKEAAENGLTINAAINSILAAHKRQVEQERALTKRNRRSASY